jgi:ferrous iron transport protein B
MGHKSSAKRVIALIGNPNSGKTALFNALTQSHEKVGNWPGVTVERKSGEFVAAGRVCEVVDLPGVYSAHVSDMAALDEKIACDYLWSGAADLIVHVIDGSHLVRHLYLTMQLREMGLPLILVVNMLDLVEQQGLQIDLAELARLSACPVYGVVATRAEGVAALQAGIARLDLRAHRQSVSLKDFFPALEQHGQLLTQEIQAVMPSHASRARCLALRLLEGDAYAASLVTEPLRQQVKAAQEQLRQVTGEDADTLLAEARYQQAGQWADAVTRLQKPGRVSLTERIDRWLLNRYLGLPIFFMLMYLLFVFSINVGGAFQDFFDLLSQGIFVDAVAAGLQACHSPPWLIALLAYGLGRAINTVLTFMPVIGAMFLGLGFLEEVGYMARAAFVMDRLMRYLGLPGRSFVPMLIGFGCNVPAILATRTLANARDRILTVLMLPFMSCSARLAIFSVFAAAFFPEHAALVIFALYLLGMFVAVLSGLVLRRTVLPGKPAPLVMELPAYHWPKFGSLLSQAAWRLKGFVWRAGRYIVPIGVLVGMLNAIDLSGHLSSHFADQAILASMGHWVTPLFAPMGIAADNWPATVGLMTGVLAKEVVIGTLNSLYNTVSILPVAGDWTQAWSLAWHSVGDNLSALGAAFLHPLASSAAPASLSSAAMRAILQHFSVASAFAYLVFVLLYFPCVSTLAVMRREIGASWARGSLIWSTGLAYGLAVVSYQALTFLSHPLSSLAWILGVLLVLGLGLWFMKRRAEAAIYVTELA